MSNKELEQIQKEFYQKGYNDALSMLGWMKISCKFCTKELMVKPDSKVNICYSCLKDEL